MSFGAGQFSSAFSDSLESCSVARGCNRGWFLLSDSGEAPSTPDREGWGVFDAKMSGVPGYEDGSSGYDGISPGDGKGLKALSHTVIFDGLFGSNPEDI